MNDKFEYKTIKIEDLIKEYEDGVLKIPRIQRNLVWKKTDKQQLQISIMKKFPLGGILFSKINGKKYIIDGLQRTTTIVDIFSNMFQYMEEETLEEIVSQAIQFTSEKDHNYIIKINPNDINELKKMIIKKIILKTELSEPRKPECFAEDFFNTHSTQISKINPELNYYFITQVLQEIHKISSSKLDIDDYLLSSTVFYGSHEESSTLFELINTKGVKLDNSDIWRSHWSTIEMDFTYKKISKKIEEKLNIVIENSFGFKYQKEEKLSPFDVIWYIFEELFSKNWDNHISKTFSGKEDNSKLSNQNITSIPSLIILIKTYIIFEYQKKEHDFENFFNFTDNQIGLEFKKLVKEPADVDNIISDLYDSVEKFDLIFKLFHHYRGNKKEHNSGVFLPDKTYIIVILGNIYKGSHLFEKMKKIDFVNKYKKRFIKHYIHDLLSEPFKTSSSKTAFNYIKENKYLEDLENGAIKNAIENFYFTSLNNKAKSFDKKSRTLMSYLFMQDLTLADNDDLLFEDDHLIPKSKLLTANINTAISSFANLSLITKEENRDKSDYIEMKYIYSDKIYIWAKNKELELANLLEESYKNIFENGIDKKSYENFLESRKKIIIKMYEDK